MANPSIALHQLSDDFRHQNARYRDADADSALPETPAAPTPAFSQHSASKDYVSYGRDNTSHSNVNDREDLGLLVQDFNRTKRHAHKSLFALFTCWYPELIASALSILSLGCLIAVLRIYDGRPLTGLGLPRGLTLNGLVAAIATVNRAFLNAPTCAAIMQEMWLYYISQPKKKESRSRLRDIETFSEASYGVWGSLVLLFKIRNASAFVVYVGCLLTIFSLAYSAFVQQLVGLETLPTSGGAKLPNIPRTERWAGAGASNTDELKVGLPLDMTAAIYSGALVGGSEPLQAQCPSGNCTWPLTPSLAVCGACQKSTYTLLECDQPSEADNATLLPVSSCTYRLPSGETVQLVNPEQDSIEYNSYGTGFAVVPGNGSMFNATLDNRFYMMNVELFGTPYSADLGHDFSTRSNTECALWPCIQIYNTTVRTGIQDDAIVFTSDKITWSNYSMELDFEPLPVGYDLYGETNFTISLEKALDIAVTLKNRFNGTVTLFESYPRVDSDLIHSAWRGSTDAQAWITNLAASMTNVVRTSNSSTREQYRGTSEEVTVVIRWWWLILPAALVVMSALFLVLVIVRTARQSEAGSWKASPLTFLLFDLDAEIKDKALRRMQQDGFEGAREAVGKSVVTLVGQADGGRKFKAA